MTRSAIISARDCQKSDITAKMYALYKREINRRERATPSMPIALRFISRAAYLMAQRDLLIEIVAHRQAALFSKYGI